jgi:dienelactone hydrolase
MHTKRREFLKLAGKAGLSIAGMGMIGEAAAFENLQNPASLQHTTTPVLTLSDMENEQQSIIGLYGSWAASLNASHLPALSFRRREWSNLAAWKKLAKKRVTERMAIPSIGAMPGVNLKKQYVYDGLHIEELTWQLPYGRPTEAILLKPANANGPLPGILAFHDHGGNKYFGTRKITRTSDEQHPLIKEHQADYYEGMAWANEMAKRGYVVLVSDAFSFASQRVMMQDVPAHLRNGLTDEDPEKPENINAYNKWAGEHEHVMAKSLFSAGTTWPGVFFAEDQKALDILCSRRDVDAKNIGCCGLSGGGLRTVVMGGLDSRIKCAVCVGFMTTWKDFLLYKSFTHTWMVYVPLLPNELDFPEILGLRTPLPTLVLNDKDDGLYTPEGMKAADNILSEVYQKAKAGDRYRCSFYPGGHKFDKAMQAEAFAWFDKWLKVI